MSVNLASSCSLRLLSMLSLPSAFCHGKTQQEGPRQVPDPCPPAFRTVRNKFLSLINYSVSGMQNTDDDNMYVYKMIITPIYTSVNEPFFYYSILIYLFIIPDNFLLFAI
jgi:hypothetical protein